MSDQSEGATSSSAALIAACDRICGVRSNYHKDRCPLYKANCQWMDEWNAKARTT